MSKSEGEVNLRFTWKGRSAQVMRVDLLCHGNSLLYMTDGTVLLHFGWKKLDHG